MEFEWAEQGVSHLRDIHIIHLPQGTVLQFSKEGLWASDQAIIYFNKASRCSGT